MELAVIVDLEWYEVMQAAEVGLRRAISVIRNNSQDSTGAPNAATWSYNIEGAIAELAVAKAFGMFWPGTVNTYKSKPDLGPWEIRCTPYPNGDLWIYPEDEDDRPYILVTGVGKQYTIRGWIMGRAGKKPEWFYARKEGRAPCFWIKQDQLAPMEDLPCRR